MLFTEKKGESGKHNTLRRAEQRAGGKALWAQTAADTENTSDIARPFSQQGKHLAPAIAEEAKSPPLASLRTTGWSQRLHCHLAEGKTGTNSVCCSESTFSTRNQTPCRMVPGTTGGPGDPLPLSLTISLSHRVRTPHRGKCTQAAGRQCQSAEALVLMELSGRAPQRGLLLKRTRAGVARSPDGHGCWGGTIASTPACTGAQAAPGALRTRCRQLRTFRSQRTQSYQVSI